MSLNDRRGPLNAGQALTLVLDDELPGAISTANADDAAELFVKGGPWTIPVGGKTFILSVGGSSVTVALPAGVYSAASLVAALNGDAGFAALFTASIVLTTMVRIKANVSTPAVIQVGAGTGNSALGLAQGLRSNHNPLRTPALITLADSEWDPPIYPAIIVDVTDWSPRDDREMVDYTATITYIETSSAQTAGDSVEYLIKNCLRMYDCIDSVLGSNTSLGRAANGHFITGARHEKAMFNIDQPIIRVRLIITVTIHVEEDL
jgi:hypothetical protein